MEAIDKWLIPPKPTDNNTTANNTYRITLCIAETLLDFNAPDNINAPVKKYTCIMVGMKRVATIFTIF
jgi:hypothetical protein